MKDKRALVTGGAGFIGSHLVHQLLDNDWHVTLADRSLSSPRYNPAQLNTLLDVVEIDLQANSWERILSRNEYHFIFHLSGTSYVPDSIKSPESDFFNNLYVTYMLLENLRKARWSGVLIFTSSAAVYGNPLRMPIDEDDPTIPISPYGVAKLAAERYISVYCQLYDIRASSLRLFSVYGPGQQKLVVYDLIKKIQSNPNEILIYGDGSQLRDFIYVQDVINAMLMIAERGRHSGEAYNVASGSSCSIIELATLLCRLMNANPRFTFGGEIRPGDPYKWSVDISRVKSLGFDPEISLQEGLKRTIDWYFHNQ